MHRILLFIVLAISAVSAEAQSIMDKAERFSYDSLYNLVLNSHASVEWHDGKSQYFSYCNERPDGKEYFLVNTDSWKRTRFADKASLDAEISRIMATGGGKNRLSESPDTGGNTFAGPRKDWQKSWSADSLYYITAYDDDLYLFRTHIDADGRKVITDSIRLSHDGEHFHSFATGGNSEKPSKGNVSASGRWIGRSHKFLTIREDRRNVGTLTLVNSLSRPRPQAKTWKYAMPGDKEVIRYEVLLADADIGKLVRLDMDRFEDQSFILPRFSNYPHTDRFAWLLRISRTRDTLDLCRIDASDNSVKVIISEECKPHLNEQMFSFHILNDGEEILWWSERSGKGRYYLYDGGGNLKNVITPDNVVAGKIACIDTLGRSIIYEGYGGEKGINPHYRFFYKATFGGRNNLLTPGNGDHEISLSPDRKFIVDTYSRMDMAPRHQICDLKGRIRFELEPCDLSRLYKRGWKEPEVIEVMAADSATRLYGVVYLPFDIEPGKKYPIISSVYPGPQTDLVPQSFSIDDDYSQSLAQLGFIVIKFSYRGSSPLRGKDFYTFGYGNLRDYPLEDDYAVIRQIALRYPFADLDRVGIYGHSGGGFMAAAAMLTRPDFYKVGIAASGNHDNNIYMQWWGESFHGVTRKEGEDGSTQFECRIPTNIELAGNLKGRLLLITGDMDNNVHPANTFRMADALIKQGKRFDMMVIPGADHGLGDRYYINLIRYYFVENLLGIRQEDIDIIRHK